MCLTIICLILGFHAQRDSNMFWAFAVFGNMEIEPETRIANLCPTDKEGVTSYFIDIDGSMRPPNFQPGNPGTLLSNATSMTHFVSPGQCAELHGDCYMYCTNTCFRTVRYSFDAGGTEDWKLKVCRRNNHNDCTLFGTYLRWKDAASRDKYWSGRYRMFSAHLPEGQYDATILDEHGNPAWPRFVKEAYQESMCPNSFQDGDVRLIQPVVSRGDCTNLIINGNFQASNTSPYPFLNRWGGLVLERGQGFRWSNAGASEEPDRRATIIQSLDNRCLSLMKGETYRIRALMKSLNGPIATNCNPDEEECPVVGFKQENSGYQIIASVEAGIDMYGFQRVDTQITITEEMATAIEPQLFFRLARSDRRLVIDNVLMQWIPSTDSTVLPSPTNSPVTYPPASSPTAAPTEEENEDYGDCGNHVIGNSHMENGWENFWEPQESGTFSLESGHESRRAIRYSDRASSADGPRYISRRIDISCFKPGNRYEITAQFKLINRITNNPSSCVTFLNCPRVRVELEDRSGVFFSHASRAYDSFFWNADSFNLYRTTITIPNSGWDGTTKKVTIEVGDFPFYLDLIMDDFVMKRVDGEYQQ